MPHNPYEAYKKQSVMTMTPVGMLTMLYDGILKELTLAKIALDKKDFHLYGEINQSLQKARTIINHLKSTLDFKYDIAKNLESLYDYFTEQIQTANTKKDASSLDEVIAMVTDLRNTYEEADRRSRASQQIG